MFATALLPLLLAIHPTAISTGTDTILGTRMTDLDGRIHRLGGEAAEPTVLVFLGSECPISRRYVARLNELAVLAGERGVGFLGVLSEPETDPATARVFRDETELAFPVLFDASGELAARLQPTHVPEAFAYDLDGTLVYRGRIDDRFAAVGKLRPAITSHDLRDALEAIAAGKTPANERSEPVGCVFEAWAEEDRGSRPVTYTRDIAPLLAANCVTCHRQGDVAPFSLASYEDARKRARMIASVCESGFMPPWQAEQGHGSFRDERRLSRRQKKLLTAWAEAGAPEGDPKELLPPPALPSGNWRFGEPDYVVSMPIDYEVPAAGDDIYRYFVVPSELTADVDVVAVDFRPGDPSVVHHCLVYLDARGSAKALDAKDEEVGFSLFGKNAVRGNADFLRTGAIAGWAPGNLPYRYPEGMAMRLPGGVDFVLEVHYHLTGEATRDRSQLALYLADGPVERHVEGLVIGTEQVDIPAGDDAYGRYVWMEVPADLDVIDVTPHMHYLGREVEAYATLPDGTQEPLIRIDDWDFRWQDTYVYRRPLHLPKGTRIEAFFRYDNSADNPFNPSSPPIRVKEGWQTTDEMCLFYFSVVPANPRDFRGISQAALASFLRSADG